MAGLPVNFFDRALPKWPTFGINLRSFHPDHPRNRHLESQNSWMPRKNNEGIVEWWTRFENDSGNGDLLGFLGAIKDTMQNWRDNAQFKVPGFRDRVVHVSLDSNEAGLNLNMPPDLIDTLSSRGRYAGQKLVQHFTASPEEVELSWDNHRWVRFRSTMALLEEMLGGMYASFQYTQPGDRSYADLIRRNLDEVPLSYRWREETQREYALQTWKKLLELIGEWQEQDYSFADRAPNPKPDLRITPRI